MNNIIKPECFKGTKAQISSGTDKEKSILIHKRSLAYDEHEFRHEDYK